MSKNFNPNDLPSEVQQYLSNQALEIEVLEQHKAMLLRFTNVEAFPPARTLYQVGLSFMHFIALNHQLNPVDHEDLVTDLTQFYERLFVAYVYVEGLE